MVRSNPVKKATLNALLIVSAIGAALWWKSRQSTATATGATLDAGNGVTVPSAQLPGSATSFTGADLSLSPVLPTYFEGIPDSYGAPYKALVQTSEGKFTVTALKPWTTSAEPDPYAQYRAPGSAVEYSVRNTSQSTGNHLVTTITP